jgi:hypothetical protein
MSFTKYASLENDQILGIKGSTSQIRTASLEKFADFEDFRTEDGFLYARIRAISSRVNKNHDGWPSVELAGGDDIFNRIAGVKTGSIVVEADSKAKHGYSTFLGKPIFVDHHNSDPTQARGVIVDAKLHIEDHKTAAHDPYYASAPENHMPPTWVELLLEIDAKSFPKLAKAIIEGSKDPSKGIDGFSMGCDVQMSKCSHCGNEATSPEQYCEHVQMKGAEFPYTDRNGKTSSRKSYEDCYGIGFFEISAVFDPADETALLREIRAHTAAGNPEEEFNQAEAMGRIREKAFDPVSGDIACTNCQGAGCEACHGTGQGNPYSVQNPGGDGFVTPGLLGPSDMTHEPVDPQAAGYGPRRQGGIGDAADKAVDFATLGEYGMEPQFDYHSILHMPNVDVRNHLNNAGVEVPYMASNNTPYMKKMLADHHGVEYPETGGTDPYGNFVDPFDFEAEAYRQSSTHTAEAPPPQVDELKMPEQVDTLREESVCPVCGSDMDEETCAVCGYTRPPEGFGNPDLTKANPDAQQEDEGQEHDETFDGSMPPEGDSTSNNPSFAHVTNDMDWKVSTTHESFTNPSTETPVVPNAGPATDEPKGSVVKQDHSKPVTSQVRTAEDFLTVAGAKRRTMPEKTADAASGAPEAATPDKNVDAEAVGGVMEATNEDASKADAQIDVEGVGTTGVSDVAADNTETVDQGDEHSKNIEEIPTKTFDNGTGVEKQRDPVGSDVYPAEGGVTSSWQVTALDDGAYPAEDGGLGGGGANEGTQPADAVGTPDERVDVLDSVTSPGNNSGETKTWSGTDGNGVTRQQEPVTNETLEGDDIVNLSPSTSAHIFAAFKVAETEVDLGLTAKEQKFERAAELEKLSPEALQAEARVVTRVKTAGLSKGTKTAKRMPSLGRNASVDKESSEDSSTDTVNDSQLFL